MRCFWSLYSCSLILILRASVASSCVSLTDPSLGLPVLIEGADRVGGADTGADGGCDRRDGLAANCSLRLGTIDLMPRYLSSGSRKPSSFHVKPSRTHF